MADFSIEVTVYSDEIIAALSGLPKKLRDAVTNKLEAILSEIREEIFHDKPGKYLDPTTVVSGVTTLGSTLVGFLEATDKGGFYIIVPVKAKLLRFIGTRDGQLVRTKLVRHPFLKGSDIISEKIADLKPWIEDQLNEALSDVR